MARTLAAALILAGLTPGLERPVFRPADTAAQIPRVTTPTNANGVIRGRVVINGAPASGGTRVQARRTYIVSGERQITPAGASATTNNDGFYEIAGLKPGEYVVIAEPEAWDIARRVTSPVAMQPTLHPSATDLAAAHSVRVDAGGTAEGIDVNCLLNTPFSISGRIVTSDGKPGTMAGAGVRSIVPFGIIRGSRFFIGGDTSKPDDPGAFWIGGLPSGRYELTAAPGGSNTGEWARIEVTLSGRDVTGLVLTLEKGITATGRVVFRSHRSTPIPDPSQIAVMIAGAAETVTGVGVIAQPALSADFTFSAADLRPGRYAVQIRLPDTLAGTWSIESTEIADVREAMRCCSPFGVRFDVAPRAKPEPVTVVLTDRVASLSGVVTDGAGRASSTGVVAIVPVDRSAWIQGSSRMPAPVRPDLDGRYAFGALPPGDYHLTVLSDVDLDAWKFGIWPDVDTVKAARVSIASGEQKSLSISVGGGSTVAALPARKTGLPTVASAKVGAISGRVSVERPRQSLEDVRAFRVWTSPQDERKLGGPPGGYQAQFDHDGEYVFRTLPEGDYVIAAVALDASGLRSPLATTSPTSSLASRAGSTFMGRTNPTFYPAALELAAAEVVRVAAGADVRGINVSLVARPWSRVEGRVMDPSGQPSPYAQVEIGLVSLPAELRPMLGLQRMTPLADGSFAFMMPTGRYVIAARGSGVAIPGVRSTSRHFWGQSEVMVTGFDVNDVVVRLEEGATISGTVTFAGAEPPRTERHDFAVAAIPERDTPGAIVASIPAGVNRDGTFTIVGVVPGRYTLMAMAVFGDQQWSVAHAIADGRNVVDQPLEVRAGQSISGVTVVMSDRRTELTCTVQDDSGATTTAYAIAVVPADPAVRRIGSPRLPAPGRPPESDGRYVVAGLPPGDYLIFALADLDADAWKAGIWPELNPAAAVKVSIGAGEKKAVAVRISR